MVDCWPYHVGMQLVFDEHIMMVFVGDVLWLCVCVVIHVEHICCT